jgi:hypothetical protein
MDLGPQKTRYPSPDEQSMNRWYWSDYKGQDKVEVLGDKTVSGSLCPS